MSPPESREGSDVAAHRPGSATAAAASASKSAAGPGKLQPPGPDSWPSFRNGHAQLGVAGSKLPEDLELLWKKKTVDGIVAAAAIVGHHVYVPALSGRLFCLERRTGDEIWSYRSIDDPDPETFAPGFKAAPTVTADAVYLGDEEGAFHAVDRATGKQKWIFKTGAEIAGGAAVVGDHVIVGSHDSFLYCLNVKDGSVVWKFQTEDRVNCSVAIAGGYTFVAGCDEHLRVIDIKTGEQKSDIPLGSFLIASPAVIGEELYVGMHKGDVVAVDWKAEEISWRYKDPRQDQPYHASCAVTDKYVVVGGHDKQMHCIDRMTGERVWVFPTRAQINSSAVIVGDRVFFGSNDRNIYALRLSDGRQLWKHNAGAAVSASPAVGEGVLVIGSEGSGGEIFCFGEKGE